MLTWQWQLVDVVEAEFERAVLLAGLGLCAEYDEAQVAVLEEVDGPAVGILDVVLNDLAVKRSEI